MTNYDSTARVPFKHGGSVKKPKVKRIILWKGKAKDWPGAKEAARQTRNRKAHGGSIDDKLRKLGKEIKANPLPSKTKSLLKQLKKSYARRKYEKGGRIGLKQGGAFLPLRGGVTTAKAFRGKSGFKESQALQKKITGKTKRPPEDREKLSSKRVISILKQHGHKSKVKGNKIKAAYTMGDAKGNFKTKVDTLPKNPTLARVKDWLGYKKGGKVSDRHPPSEKEKRAQRQAEYIKKHGKPEPRRKTLAVTDKYKELKPFTRKATLPKVRPQRHGIRRQRQQIGGIIGFKKGGRADKKWIQKATKGMRKDKPCTGKKFGSATCPPGSKRYNLAQTFKKMARSKHASGGLVRYI